MSEPDFTDSEGWVERCLEAHAAEIRARQIEVHCEFDPAFHLRPSALLDDALNELLRFALATVPDGCEVYVATSRALAPVAPLGAGSLTLRWQVAGASSPRMTERPVRALHPIAGEAATHVASAPARSVREAFGNAGWCVDLHTLEGGREIFVRAHREGS